MNILFYTHFSPYSNSRVGGAETSIKTIAEMMATKGHQSVFVTRGRRKLTILREKKTVNNVQVYTLHKFRFPTLEISFLKKINIFLNRKLFDYQIIKLIDKHKISLVHAHYNLDTCKYFLNLKKTHKADFKFVMRFAGMLWHENLKTQPQLIEDYKFIFENTDSINFISDGLYQLYNKVCKENGYIFKMKNVFIHDIGTRYNQLPVNNHENKRESVFKMVMATRFTHYQKKHKILVEAIARIKTTIPVELCLIGNGPNIENIQNLINKLNLNDCVKIISFLPQKQLWEHLIISDILCHACEYEGLSKIIIESMGMGLPVLASNVLPLNNYIVDGETGFLTENTPEEWANKITEIYKNRDNLTCISNNAREYILKNYDAKNNIEKYINVFEELIK